MGGGVAVVIAGLCIGFGVGLLAGIAATLIWAQVCIGRSADDYTRL